uniref:Bifunctional inhibitor/plant lipid transfer protein/seed storage helical domain-containing protein n=1 Tax=Leersia perrieri TaxID=77586 RepID=A0A0D9VUN7_9ORYZ
MAAAPAFCLLALALALAAAVDGATSPAPAPAVDCLSEALKLSDCLDYVTPGNAAAKRPSKTCCTEVKSALKDSVAVGCLCSAFSSKGQLPIPINVTRAFHLPAACGADSHALTRCLAPSPSPSMAPGTPSSGSGGAAAAPANGAAAARSPVVSTTAVLVVAAVAAPVLAFFHL